MEVNILDDEFLKAEAKLINASQSKRFYNYLIDQAIMLAIVVVFYLLLESIFGMNIEEINPIVDRLFTMLLFAICYMIFEISLKGKTPGKYITKTRTVMRDTGSVPDANTIVKRSFSRIVPFDALSFLGGAENGWHDKWSDTMVIDEELSVVSDDNVWIERI